MLEREKKDITWSNMTLRTIFDNNNDKNKEDTGNIMNQDITG